MKETPVKGDWIVMVKYDMSSLNMTLSDEDISVMGIFLKCWSKEF